MTINPVLVWFILGLVLAFLEFAVPGVILVFFGAGAWLVSLTTFLGWTVSYESQLMLFVISSVILIVALRRWIQAKFTGHVSDVQDLKHNLDEFAGKSVKVLEDIKPDSMDGAVELKGARWQAVSDQSINAGETAEVVRVEGIKLHVKKTGGSND